MKFDSTTCEELLRREKSNELEDTYQDLFSSKNEAESGESDSPVRDTTLDSAILKFEEELKGLDDEEWHKSLFDENQPQHSKSESKGEVRSENSIWSTLGEQIGMKKKNNYKSISNCWCV